MQFPEFLFERREIPFGRRLRHFPQCVDTGRESPDRFPLCPERLQSREDFVRPVRIVPEAGGLRLRFQRGYFLRDSLRLKESPSPCSGRI